MCGFVSVQLFNDRVRYSEALVHRLPAWEAFSYDHAETLLSSVSDRLRFCALPDFGRNSEAPRIFNPASALNDIHSFHTYVNFNADPKDITPTGTVTPGPHGQDRHPLSYFTGVQYG
jgi:hypothetical protein